MLGHIAYSRGTRTELSTDRFDRWKEPVSTEVGRCWRLGKCRWKDREPIDSTDGTILSPRMLVDVDESGIAAGTALSECREIETVLCSTFRGEGVRRCKGVIRDCAFSTLTEQTILTPRLAEKMLMNRGYGRDCSNIVPNISTISILRSRNKSVANMHVDRFSLNARKWSISVLEAREVWMLPRKRTRQFLRVSLDQSDRYHLLNQPSEITAFLTRLVIATAMDVGK